MPYLDKEPNTCGCMWGLNEVALTVSAYLPCCDIVAMVMWEVNTGGSWEESVKDLPS